MGLPLFFFPFISVNKIRQFFKQQDNFEGKRTNYTYDCVRKSKNLPSASQEETSEKITKEKGKSQRQGQITLAVCHLRTVRVRERERAFYKLFTLL